MNNEDKPIEIPRRLYLEILGENEDLKQRLDESNRSIERMLRLPQSRLEKLRDMEYIQTLRRGFRQVAELEKQITAY